jgi:class 3 adenylate cyclase/tetratricopeptide (TPR) repeat protein
LADRGVPAPAGGDVVRVFVSYSHKDPAYLADDSLLGFLKGLTGEAGVEFWTDERITASSVWNDEIRKQLAVTDIALVLVSQAFLDSPFCTQIEIESFLEDCRKRGLLIFPVVLSPCEWERHEWLATRQFLPGGSETIEEHYTEPGKQKRLFLRIRKELRQAVESVRQARAAAAAAVPLETSPGFAEKRQVTFLRCDLLPREPDGSPLDPGDASEVLYELMPEFDKATRELFARYDAYVAGTGSGGTLACFGYPEVAEDDSRRAVRAGLELVSRIAALSTRFEAEMGVSLATRVAVHTGTVVTSPGQEGEDLSRGDVPMATMYLQQEAAMNTVIISASTLRLVEPFFEVEPAGSIRLPGGAATLDYSRIVSDKGFETRFEATASRTLTPIVGREEEMALLLDRWQGARAGRGGVVMLSAEAGVGKSRLLKQVRTAVAGEPHTWLEWRCSPYYRDTALHPVIEAMKDSLGITHDTSEAEKLERLGRALAAFDGAGDDLLPLVAPVLSIRTAAPSAATPQEQKELMLQALAAYVELTAMKTPAVLVIEDLHWIDPSTVELLDLLIREAPSLPLLVLLTYRPEYTPPSAWMAQDCVSQLALGKLDREQVEQMMLHLTGGKALPRAVADEIFAKTDGFPLFVEDLTHMVIESDLLEERNGAYELVGPFQSLSIPATLYETIMARLARLATAKPIAQLGAAIGREFVYEMLRAVASLDDQSLKRELDRLVAAGLLYRRGLLSRAKYIFKHALVQEALHESLLKRQRKQYHKLVADVLEEKFPDVVRDEPELVARHFAEAEIGDKAARYYMAAAQHALASSANLEVLGHTSNALTMLERLPDTDERAQLELAVRCVQGNALVALRGWASEESGQCYRRARELCDRLPGAPQLSQVLKGLSVYQHTSAHLIEACATAEEMHRKATSEGNLPFELEALGALCCTHFWRGQLEAAARYGSEGLAMYDASLHHLEHISLFGEDPGALLYTFTAMSLAVLGLEDQAERINEQALLDYEVYTHIHSRCYLLAGVMFTNLQMRRPERVLELSARLLAIANEHRFPGWIGIATPMRGWALTATGEVEQGIAMIKAGREGWRATGGRLHSSQYPSLIAEAYMSTGRFEDAEEWLRIGMADAAECTEGYSLSEPWRLKGELAVLTGKLREDAEACYLRSLEIAREQGALMFELRTEVSYCELLRHDDPAAARARLSAVTARFTEGSDSWDMRRARALLDRLG